MLQYGIHHVRSSIECYIPEWEVETWGILWNYFINSLSAKSVLVGEKLIATYSISTSE